MASCQQTIQKRVEFKLDFIFSDPRSTKGTQRITANFRPAATEALNSQMPLIGIPGFVPWQVRVMASCRAPEGCFSAWVDVCWWRLMYGGRNCFAACGWGGRSLSRPALGGPRLLPPLPLVV